MCVCVWERERMDELPLDKGAGGGGGGVKLFIW